MGAGVVESSDALSVGLGNSLELGVKSHSNNSGLMSNLPIVLAAREECIEGQSKNDAREAHGANDQSLIFTNEGFHYTARRKWSSRDRVSMTRRSAARSTVHPFAARAMS